VALIVIPGNSRGMLSRAERKVAKAWSDSYDTQQDRGHLESSGSTVESANLA